MSDPQTKLGQINPDGDDVSRDAIHIAVAPVKASMHLLPGDHIGFVADDSELVGRNATNLLGIVDPFIKVGIKKGQRFFMYLYPNTITSLHHVWEHPAFSQARFPNPFYSKMWMHNYAKQYGFTGERMVRAATDYLDHGNRFSDGGTFEGESVPDEFWTHYERITGRIVTNDRDNFFSCSC